MCGIAGGFWASENRGLERKLDNCLHLLAKRGPDDSGKFIHRKQSATLALVQRRLSIIDLSPAGHQPMPDLAGRYTLVFNGIICNYIELREQLSIEGVRFRTQTDTEVLLAAWARWGTAALKRFIGMFAFAVFDKEENSLTCVRDPFGVKPLYYAHEGKDFVFASEMPAINALRNERQRLHWQRAYDYLRHGDYDSNASTFVEGVQCLMPGHLLRLDLNTGRVDHQRWWKPITQPVSTLTFDQAASALRKKILDSVRLNLRSDVAVGTALSGGIDSSVIVCAVRHLEPDIPIHTFSFVARGHALSEESWVDRVNSHVGALATKVETSPGGLATDLDDMIATQGEPFGSTSIYAQYCVFRAAKERGVTVTLDGQGADELLAGYNGYPGQRMHSLLDNGQFGGAWDFLRKWSQWPARGWINGVKAGIAENTEGRLNEVLRRLASGTVRPRWLHADVLREAGVQMRFPGGAPELATPGRRVVAELAEAVMRRGLPALLRHGDRNAMRFSIESRVPFLTTDLADFLLTLPEQYLISQNGETKSVLRASMRGIVPDAILDRRDKIGFATPEREWLVQIAPQAREWLREDTKLPFLDQARTLSEFDAMIAGQRPFSWQAWRWINFTRWYNRHMAG
jgi:asparagine synthase (glutamine-hydrolysing)